MSNSADAGLAPETMSLIRDMITEHPPTPASPRQATRAASQPDPVAAVQDDIATSPRASARIRPIEHVMAEPDAAPLPAPAPSLVRTLIGTAIAHIKGFRPTRRQIIAAALILVVLIWPAWVIFFAVLNLIVVLGVFLCFGGDRVWGGVVRALSWYIQRAPERGTRLTARIDRFADRWDGILDRFPDGWVDGLYLPDVRALLEADKLHDDALNARFDRMSQHG